MLNLYSAGKRFIVLIAILGSGQAHPEKLIFPAPQDDWDRINISIFSAMASEDQADILEVPLLIFKMVKSKTPNLSECDFECSVVMEMLIAINTIIYTYVNEPLQPGWSNQRAIEALHFISQSDYPGNITSALFLAYIHLGALGIEANQEAFLSGISQSAALGFRFAQSGLADLYKGESLLEKNEVKSYEWDKKAATQGLAIAQANTGSNYLFGTGVEKNQALGIHWLTLAAGQENDQYDHDVAYTQLFLYQVLMSQEVGEEVVKDEEQILYWLRRSAKNGNATAQRYLSEHLEDGTLGVQKDISEAEKWLRLSANNGDTKAQVRLALQLRTEGKDTKNQKLYADHYLLLRTALTAPNDEKYQKIAEELFFSGMFIDISHEDSDDWQTRQGCEALKIHADALSTKQKNSLLYLGAQAACSLSGSGSLGSHLQKLSDAGNYEATMLGANLREKENLLGDAIQLTELAYTQYKKNSDCCLILNPETFKEAHFEKEISRLRNLKQQRLMSKAEQALKEVTNEQGAGTPFVLHREPNPFMKFLGNTAGLVLEGVALGLQEALRHEIESELMDLVAPNSSPNAHSQSSAAPPGSFGTPGYRANSSRSEVFGASAYQARPSNSCSCKCVNGEMVALCSSAYDAAPVCSGYCPVYVPLPQDSLVNPYPAPSGTTRCRYRGVYNSEKFGYETTTVCD